MSRLSQETRVGHGVTLLIACILLTAGLAPVGTADDPARDDPEEEACTFEEVDGIGPACKLDSGLWKIKHGDGTYGYTHGPDPVPPEGPGQLDHVEPREPRCAEDPDTDYHHVVIYAHAHDQADRYSTIAPELRETVHEMNGHLHDEARISGAMYADYRFHCTDGEVTVFGETLPTSRSQASFTTIVNDLQTLGYDNNRVKYMVWYDDQDACTCGGLGHIYSDDDLTLDNANNGAPTSIPMFGVTFGYLDQAHRIMMHENGHNMGAVQASAPHGSPGGLHCNDGQDIMCYDDSGSAPSEYDPNVCPGYERFDCNRDDYFHPLPASANYLADHWNLGSQLNRFLEVAVPFDVTAAPTQSTFSPLDQPTIEISVDSAAGEGVHEAPLEVEASYQTGVENLTLLLQEQAPCATTWTATGETHTGDEEITAPTLADRCSDTSLPGELPTSPEGEWHVVVTATKYGQEEVATTSYEVQP